LLTPPSRRKELFVDFGSTASSRFSVYVGGELPVLVKVSRVEFGAGKYTRSDTGAGVESRLEVGSGSG